MKRLALAVLLALTFGAPASAGISVERAGKSTFNVTASAEPLSSIVGALGLHLRASVAINTSRDPLISYRARNASPEAALRGVVAAAKLELRKHDAERWEIVDPAEPVVTLDVKDAETRVILKSLQRQCGVKNLIVDPNVGGKGTFLFTDVPCRQAFSVVLRTLGLEMAVYSNDVVTVGQRRQ
jgi:hypothetical protein